jgi:beta-glucosidase
LYIHNRDARILQPIKQLEGFTRVSLDPGQTRTVTFKLKAGNLGYYDNNGHFQVTPGTYDAFVGDSSDGGLQGQFSLQ